MCGFLYNDSCARYISKTLLVFTEYNNYTTYSLYHQHMHILGYLHQYFITLVITNKLSIYSIQL